MLNVITTKEDAYPGVTFNIDDSLSAMARKLQRGNALSSTMLALSEDAYISEEQYAAVVQLIEGLRMKPSDLSELSSRVLQGLAKVPSWARPKLVPGLETVVALVTAVVSGASCNIDIFYTLYLSLM